jgi:multiple sugar transport system permease protein
VSVPPLVVTPPRAPRPRGGVSRRENALGYLFLSPWLLGFLLLTAGPMVASLLLSFTEYNLFRPPTWVGLDNFREMFGDVRFLQSVKVTAIYVFVGTPIKLAAALAVAVLLNARHRGQSFYRAAFYVPSLVGTSVSVAIVWRAMFSDDAAVDTLLSGVGVDLGGWVGNPDLAMPMLILLGVWQFGAPMVIFLAGLKQVPAELLEAASLDGAGPVRRFMSVTLPMLSPVVFFNLLLETIHAFQVFASAYIVSGGTGGPAGSTLFYTLLLYLRGFTEFDMGYAAAMAWVLLIAVGLIAVVMFRTSTSWVHYAGEDR